MAVINGKLYHVILFDLDGTLTTTQSGATFRKTVDDWMWLPGRIEKLRELSQQDTHLAIVTNQGGVAFGYFKAIDFLREMEKLRQDAPWISRIYCCFSHPKANIEEYRYEDERRKPGAGMLIEAMQEFMLPINPQKVLMVGDRDEDKLAAEKAGCDFLHADTFFQS